MLKPGRPSFKGYFKNYRSSTRTKNFDRLSLSKMILVFDFAIVVEEVFVFDFNFDLAYSPYY